MSTRRFGLEPSFHAPLSLSELSIGDCSPTPAAAAADAGAFAGMTLGDCAPGTDIARAANVTGGTGSLETSAANIAAALQPGQTPDAAHSEAAADEHEKQRLELMLMGFSSLIALLGIGLATFIWLQRPQIADRMAVSMPGLYRLLLNKYYVDEVYDATIVQPIRIVSEEGLWRGVDARVIDGMVNGAGQVVGGMSAVLRLLQSGSVKAYAASTLAGVVAILAYYIWR